MSIMLCLLNFSYEEQSNKFIESLKRPESKTLTDKITNTNLNQIKNLNLNQFTNKKTETETFIETLLAKSKKAETSSNSETETDTDAKPKSNKPYTFVPKGWINIRGPGKFCINDNKRGKGLSQGPCGTHKKALWKFLSLGGKYIIVSKTGRVINDKKGLKTNGNLIISFDRHNGYNQKWLVDMKKDGALSLTNYFSSKCLDNSGSKKKGSFYVQWDCKSGNANQVFYIINPVKKSNRINKVDKYTKNCVGKI